MTKKPDAFIISQAFERAHYAGKAAHLHIRVQGLGVWVYSPNSGASNAKKGGKAENWKRVYRDL